MNKKIILSLIAFVALIGIIAPVIVSAQVGAPDKCYITKSAVIGLEGINCPAGECSFDSDVFDCGLCCLLNSVYTVTDWIFIFLMALSALMIIIAGFLYATGGGNEKQLSTAKSMITAAVIGMIMLLSADIITTTVKALLGFGG